MQVVKVSKAICSEFVITKHYSNRMPIFWKGFALVEEGFISGVVVYGQPSPSIQKYAFKDRDFVLYELSRLVIQSKNKNAASFLIANSLKLLPRPSAVVSYADTEQSHCGFVYQATNWIYTGQTISHDSMYIIDGKRVHSMSLRDRGIKNPKTWAKENNIEHVKPFPKHRYFYINGNKKEKRVIIDKLTYNVIDDYPKMNPVRYDDGDHIIKPVITIDSIGYFDE